MPQPSIPVMPRFSNPRPARASAAPPRPAVTTVSSAPQRYAAPAPVTVGPVIIPLSRSQVSIGGPDRRSRIPRRISITPPPTPRRKRNFEPAPPTFIHHSSGFPQTVVVGVPQPRSTTPPRGIIRTRASSTSRSTSRSRAVTPVRRAHSRSPPRRNSWSPSRRHSRSPQRRSRYPTVQASARRSRSRSRTRRPPRPVAHIAPSRPLSRRVTQIPLPRQPPPTAHAIQPRHSLVRVEPGPSMIRVGEPRNPPPPVISGPSPRTMRLLGSSRVVNVS
jgi:hypothetical protein